MGDAVNNVWDGAFLSNMEHGQIPHKQKERKSMSGSVNKVILVGNVGKDPEIRHTQDGKAIVNLSLATTESWRDKQGERKDKTEWHRIVIFSEGLAKVVEQYVKKGTSLYIEGQLQTRKWTDKDGVEKFSTEIVLQGFNSNLTLLGGKPEGRNDDYQRPPDKPVMDNTRAGGFSRDLDDSVPF